ncbi:MAG: glycosyltransferase [Hyphomicrobiales bacterium]|nr:glycosyltransferase [Hyphomicrobiales bacterium]
MIARKACGVCAIIPDYPRARLDIKFVVESDDPDTFAALAAVLPGAEYDLIVAPPGLPRTKPRALDIALPFARGRLLAVFDAEDVPEPDQLRRAAARFARAGADLGCVQAHLAIDNAQDNWLTGLYALDYAALFEVINPGLAALDFPMLLGGTSNHFRTDILRSIGGWDAWNVTEDADLGLRLARCGYRVETFDSQTFEEAPNAVRAFLRQRVRWMKGWMQTAYVHLRSPRALWRNLRPLAFVVTIATFVSGVLSPLLWPFFLVGLVADAWSGVLFAPPNLADYVVDVSACALAIAGVAAMVWPALVGMRRQSLGGLAPLLALLPVWHILLCLAAWRALFDLWRNPHAWAKTTHGVARARSRPRYRQSISRASSAPIARATTRPISERTTTPASS